VSGFRVTRRRVRPGGRSELVRRGYRRLRSDSLPRPRRPGDSSPPTGPHTARRWLLRDRGIGWVPGFVAPALPESVATGMHSRRQSRWARGLPFVAGTVFGLKSAVWSPKTAGRRNSGVHPNASVCSFYTVSSENRRNDGKKRPSSDCSDFPDRVWLEYSLSAAARFPSRFELAPAVRQDSAVKPNGDMRLPVRRDRLQRAAVRDASGCGRARRARFLTFACIRAQSAARADIAGDRAPCTNPRSLHVDDCDAVTRLQLVSFWSGKGVSYERRPDAVRVTWRIGHPGRAWRCPLRDAGDRGKHVPHSGR
jgi:hypothetical protein